MESLDAPVVIRMQSLIIEWERHADRKAIFLRCYSMMTRNMFVAIKQGEFNDGLWVNSLLNRFTDYYFTALEAYQQKPVLAPAVWRVAHDAVRDRRISTLQNLLLGVNAHINYDLVLTLVDLLNPEWANLSDSQRASRYSDHCRVNEVISRTTDEVQDQIIEPGMPFMDWIDKILGPIDEFLISHLITRWRESVWQNATRLLEIEETYKKAQLIGQIEAEALRLGKTIATLG